MVFSRGATGLSQLPSCLEPILRVTVKAVQGNQVYLEWIGTSGSFGILTPPLDFLSSINLRSPPLEVRREHRMPFPKKQGNGPSARDKEDKMGSS